MSNDPLPTIFLHFEPTDDSYELLKLRCKDIGEILNKKHYSPRKNFFWRDIMLTIKSANITSGTATIEVFSSTLIAEEANKHLRKMGYSTDDVRS